MEAYLYDHIPLTRAMGVKIESAGPDGAILFAPFNNNTNHQKTVFGGSLHSLATLACWTYLHLRLKNHEVNLVIQKSEIDYIGPVTSDFIAECLPPSDNAWDQFIKSIEKRGKGRIHLSAKIAQDGLLSVIFHGIFVASKSLPLKM
ncbi:MAG: YiiD C-terminal domain-containing protein [Parachlamydiaceae bacterium]